MKRESVDIFTFVALAFLAFMIINAFFGSENQAVPADTLAGVQTKGNRNPEYQAFFPMIIYTSPQPQGVGGLGKVQLRVVTSPANPSTNRVGDPTAFAAPYDEYNITQGLHGYSYGHAAVDIAAGKDAQITSPINGWVSALYIDEYGNPTLILENEIYQVTLMHGKYSVQEGDSVAIGDPIGKESNKGYTTDMAGRSCRGRNCGYHSHLNVFDKRAGQNVNPLRLFPRSN